MRFVRPVISLSGHSLALAVLVALVSVVAAVAQPSRSPSTLRGSTREDSMHTARLEMATVLAKDTTLRVTIRNIDISPRATPH